MFQICQYQKRHEAGIRVLIEEIANEFAEPIAASNASTKKKVLDKYWVAEKEAFVIGTIGIIRLKDNKAILKSMFVKKEYRGKQHGVSKLLLQTAIDWSKEVQINHLFLGTMTQFKAAQRFYEKNGFYKIDSTQLPIDFIHNPVDDIFYQLDIAI